MHNSCMYAHNYIVEISVKPLSTHETHTKQFKDRAENVENLDRSKTSRAQKSLAYSCT